MQISNILKFSLKFDCFLIRNKLKSLKVTDLKDDDDGVVVMIVMKVILSCLRGFASWQTDEQTFVNVELLSWLSDVEDGCECGWFDWTR